MAPFRENIKNMSPYKPPLEGRASKGYLLLDFNEMTIEPSAHVKQALRQFVDSGRLQVYPEYGDLNEIVARYVGCMPDEVLVTNGSDQVIDVVMRAFVDKGEKVIIPSPSFAMEYQSALIQGAEIVKPRYAGPNLDFPLQEVLKLLDANPKLLVLVNPNNPTGTELALEHVRALLARAKEKNVAVLHDEAYFEFSGITALRFVKDFDNLFLSRTLSKQFGLASVRAGYVISQKDNVAELLKICGPYDVNMFARTAIEAALQDPEYSKRYIKEVMEKVKPKVEAFLKEHGIDFYPGAANFLLIKPADPEKILKALKTASMLVRPREDPPGTLRVSIGTLADMERFCKVLERAVS
ncbi:MAG: histidinol-phosphate aminotransferase family protein [Candidatus Wildermuthbacteria bacterium]|nr:histidinol-phosphate aminotransferase family protein [Candidatus Wildermuthbacteria bacterium]